MRTKLITLVVMLLSAMTINAAEPTGYYNSAMNKNKKALLQALSGIVGPHTKISYDGLWSAYRTTDVTLDGKYYWDMYATTKFPLGSKHCGSYSQVGDCVNREHSFPKSWWGGSKSDQYSDLFHLYPTDGYVNNQRSAYPFGECAGGTYVATVGTNKPLGKLGNCTFPGYSGKVFEPDDVYKGDFARTYFYMAAAYNSQIKSWTGGNMLAGNDYPVYNTWAINLLLKWHRQDPVSEKEINRNNAVYALQHNRNPFIDHPELAEYIWGDKKDQVWTGQAGDPDPVLTTPTAGTVIDMGVVRVGVPTDGDIEVKGTALTKDLTVSKGNPNSPFTPDRSVIRAIDANNGMNMTVDFESAEAGEFSDIIVISSDEVSVRVTVKATVVDGIPALDATNVTSNSFEARWTNADASTGNYTLHVTDAAGAELEGYPVEVKASAQRYMVSNLDPATTYKYYLTSGTDFSSNVVTVTTLEPEVIIELRAVSADDFVFNLEPGAQSPVIEGLLYTENVAEDVTVEVTGNFELSRDRREWSSSIELSAQGEAFYLRVADTAVAGTYNGLMTASTTTIDGYEADVAAYIAAPRNFVEGFESSPGGGYWTKEVQGDMCFWSFNNVGVWGTTSDHPHGEQSVRLGKNTNSSITMVEDKQGGAATVDFYACVYGSDSDAVLSLYYSTDAGATWVEVDKAIAVTSTEVHPTYTLNVSGPVRISIRQVSGSRVNIDDITITDMTTPGPQYDVCDVNHDGEVNVGDVNDILNTILAEQYIEVQDVNADSAVNVGDVNEVLNTILSLAAPRRPWDAVAVAGGIELTGVVGEIEVFDIDANLCATVNADTVVELPAGVYVVTTATDSKKVIVR